jgi:hypothetical protein
MYEYCVYVLDDKGEIAGATWIEAGSLDTAIIDVASRFPQEHCEIWGRIASAD